MKVVKITVSASIIQTLIIYWSLKDLKIRFTKNFNFRMSEKVYLDYNATTPIDKKVTEEIHRSLLEDWGNPSSSHALGAKAKVDL